MSQATLGIQENRVLQDHMAYQETKEPLDWLALQVDLANPVLMCIQNIFPVSEGQRKLFFPCV